MRAHFEVFAFINECILDAHKVQLSHLSFSTHTQKYTERTVIVAVLFDDTLREVNDSRGLDLQQEEWQSRAC